MVAGLAIRDPDGRPHLTRSRSHTTPSSIAVPQLVQEAATATAAVPRSPPRPSHGRSHSYLSPIETNPRNAQTLPQETTKHSHKVRLPGPLHREHKHHLRHRHTQSEAKNPKVESTDSLPHLVSKLQKEKAAAAQHAVLSRQGTNSSTSTWQSHVNNLVRIASTDPYRAMNTDNNSTPAFGAAYFRAYDGASTRQPTTKPATWIEMAVDRAAAKAELERLAPKPGDVEKKQEALAMAQDELRDRLADVGRQSGEIGRRLEYTYYSLLEKLGALAGTIHSFQSLATQSGQLIGNFESETGKLDGEVRGKIERLRDGFQEREERVGDLEGRTLAAGAKAKELEMRLRNVTAFVENWERREGEAARTWWRVWGIALWGSVVFVALVLSILMYKEWGLRGDVFYAGLGESPLSVDNSPGNFSLSVNVPEEVRKVLQGIEERRAKKALPPLPRKVDVLDERVERRRDERLMVLDEL